MAIGSYYALVGEYHVPGNTDVLVGDVVTGAGVVTPTGVGNITVTSVAQVTAPSGPWNSYATNNTYLVLTFSHPVQTSALGVNNYNFSPITSGVTGLDYLGWSASLSFSRQEELVVADPLVYLEGKTISFREDVKGWVSFKSFFPENAASCANEYYSFKSGRLWQHHIPNVFRNTFYSTGPDHGFTKSTLDVVINDMPSSVKSFKTLNYEGSQAKVTKEIKDNEYFNLQDRSGWYARNVVTNLEQGNISEFIEKEGKWFGYFMGNDVTASEDGTVSANYDTEDSSIQGIGRLRAVASSVVYGCMDPTQFNYNSAATIEIPGSCVAFIYGCTDMTANNYATYANTDDGSCQWLGCTAGPLADWTNQGFADGAFNVSGISGSINYDSNANVDDGSCIEAVYGCTVPGNYNHMGSANIGGTYLPIGIPCGYVNCVCISHNYGCTDPDATNFQTVNDPFVDANTDDGSCEYFGCTNPLATNYDFAATCATSAVYPFAGCTLDSSNGNYTYLNGNAVDDGSCIYVGGCTDLTACNYDPLAGIDDGSCYLCGDYNAENYDAAGGLYDLSCTAVCTYCNDVASATIISQTTADPGMSNGEVTIEWPASTSNTAAQYIIDGDWNANNTSFVITPSGNATETYTITGLAAGTYTFYVSTFCTGLSSTITLLAGFQLPGGTFNYTPAGGHYGTATSGTIVATPIPGCMDSTGANNNAGGTWGACNLDLSANVDDGTCEYVSCTGCNDITYLEFCGDCWDTVNQVAVASGGSAWVADTIPTSCLTFIVLGCNDPTAFNYDATATVDDGSCIPFIDGCMDDTLNNDGTYAAANYAGPGNTNGVSPPANTADGSCSPYNCPYNLNIYADTSSSSYSFAVYNFTTPYIFTGMGGINPTATIGGVTVNAGQFQSQGSIYSGSDNVGRRFYEPLTGYFTAGDTSIDVDFNVTTPDGNCDVDAVSKTFTIGCNDPLANNSGSHDIPDNTQCSYTGCMDATMDADGLNFAADNYDPVYDVSCGGDNSCCNYIGNPNATIAANPQASGLVLSYINSGTAYTDASSSLIQLGTTNPNSYTTSQLASYTQTGMNNASGINSAGPQIPGSEWLGFVDLNSQWGENSGNLLVHWNSSFSGTIDNTSTTPINEISNNVQVIQSFSAGCSIGSSIFYNWDQNIDLHIPGSCVLAQAGCMDATADNYDATANVNCISAGSNYANDCCCYPFNNPVWNYGPNFSAPYDVNAHNGTFATAVTFHFTHSSTAYSYVIIITRPDGSTIQYEEFNWTTSGNGVNYPIAIDVLDNVFLDESSYNVSVYSRQQNGDGDSCGTSASISTGIYTVDL